MIVIWFRTKALLVENNILADSEISDDDLNSKCKEAAVNPDTSRENGDAMSPYAKETKQHSETI